jgi:hypothetical protein
MLRANFLRSYGDEQKKEVGDTLNLAKGSAPGPVSKPYQVESG